MYETGHNGEKYRNYFALHEISNYSSSVFIHIRGKIALLVISSIMWGIYHILFTALYMMNCKISEGLCGSSIRRKPMFTIPMSYRNRQGETSVNKCSSRVASGGYSDDSSCLSSLTANCPVRTLMESFSPNHEVAGDHPADTKFFLFTNNNPFNPENIHDCGGKLPLNSNFNPDLKTEVFVHGFNDGVCKRAWLREMKEQVLFRGRYNVILVDWSWGSKDGNRSIAVENIKVVGEQIAFVINNIIKQTKGSERKFHLIGHSLGAHGSGFAGKQVPGLGRITALDPSRSPYEELPPNERLHQSDANVVDVIHTSAYDAGGKGFREPIGDADFYPNGPCKQSVNEQEVSRSFMKLDYSYGLIMHLKILPVILIIELCMQVKESSSFIRLPRLQCISPRKVPGCAGEGYRPISAEDTYFFLYTRRNKENAEFLHNCDNNVPANSNFKPQNPTAIIVFGFLENICNVAGMRELKYQFLQRDDYNVIIVDWSWGNIVQFLDNRIVVATQTAKLIDNIKQTTGADADKFHIVGHSVGANLIGLTGRLTKVGRLTSLDPSRVDIYDRPEYFHILKTDAKMVDTIYTNIGSCNPAFGYVYPLGHATYYVNGGHRQMSCYPRLFANLLTGDFMRAYTSLFIPGACSHYMAFEYFKASINPGDCQYIGYECEDYQHAIMGRCERKCKDDMSNCAIMGLDWKKNFPDDRTRVYYVETSMLCPYCIKQIL